ncbi:MAG TPA: radical SAM protein [Anaeromyxobacteraceae bacterium]|nr:radical SAM protein [Anaeromyxobacteraceae bacterium]
MLSPEVIAEFDRFRGAAPGTPACTAPTINLHFSQMGVVTACCFNRRQVLGVYPRNSVAEIWHGQPIRELREALARYDLGAGCEKCQQQLEARDFGGSHAVFYTVYARMLAEKRAQWGTAAGDAAAGPLPMRLEFNVHNSCNLQCVMCHGLASSAIRTQREALPAMANPYDEAFADQLEPFLPSVVEADFMGGEPFLVPVYRMLWERIARRNPRLQVCILTNGTILDERIQETLERINCWIHVSIDSIDKENYESIRRGASFDRVMENCRWFQDLMRRRGLTFLWRLCPMRLNWREIPQVLLHCNRNDIELMYNQLDSPLGLSLHTLPPSELRSVISHLEARAPAAEGGATALRNGQHYRELIERLKGFLDPGNRLNGLRARLDISDAIIGQYRQEAGATSVPLPVLDECADALVQAAKRYLTTRLNVEQAVDTEAGLPEEFSRALARRRAEMQERLAGMDERTFVAGFLFELMRTYSGVWGVSRVHDRAAFDRIDRFATAVAAHPDRSRIVADVLDASPAELYQALAFGSAEAIYSMFDPPARPGWGAAAEQGRVLAT